MSKSFLELLQEFNLAGKFKKYENSFKKDDFFSIKKKYFIKFEEFVVGYKNSFSEKKIDSVNELKDKFTPKTITKNFLKIKKYRFIIIL